MRRTSLLHAIALALPLAFAASAAGAQEHCIAAMVNDQPITGFEHGQRVKFVMLSTRMADSPENRQRVAQQVLRQMTDERLQLDDAKRAGVSVAQSEVDDRVGKIEDLNNMPSGTIRAQMAGSGIAYSVLTDQIRAAIAWEKIVRRKVRQGLDVTEPEIDEALRLMRANIGKSENRVAEIFIAVDRPDQADEGLRNARRVLEQLRGGTPFPDVARQFSQGATASNGGDLGWVLPGTLDPALDAAIAALQPGKISDPIRSPAGWHILALVDRRPFGKASGGGDLVLTMLQLLLPLPANSTAAEVERQKGVAQVVMSQARSCADLRRQCDRTKGCSAKDTEVTTGQLRASSPAIAEQAASAALGTPIGPFQAGTAIQIVAVCSKEQDTGMPSRDTIRQGIFERKLESAARRYMRDLRRTSVIEMRKNCKI
ncbi:MAG: peptidylprolyl isomerase [Rhodospirillales bacterium]|nr:MAG: peptidylprolyl isomerase [Rhodospirillales bacterium]